MPSSVRARLLNGAVGLVLAGFGITLILRPFSSLGVLVLLTIAALIGLGVAELRSSPRPWSPSVLLAAGAWFLGALVIAVWPDLGITALAVTLGLTLVLNGAGKLHRAVTGAVEERLTQALFGAASVILGGLALAWPDLTITIVAVGFGIKVTWFGLTVVWSAVRSGRRPAAEARDRGPVRRLSSLVAASLALALTLALAGGTWWLQRSEPQVDDFYTAPASVPDQPGQLLRQEEFTRGIPEGARAWRILHTTTRDEGEPALASALVVVGADPPAGPAPVLAWAHGTTGIAEHCAPSLLEDPFTAGAMPALAQVLDQGWVVVATDYVGLGTEGPHPYLIGQGEGRSVLDSIRAAHQLDTVELADQAVVWGHSQGGGAALWTGILAPDYAPELDLAGVVALAPASDLPAFAATLEQMIGGGLFAAYIIHAYAAVHPDVDVDDYVRPGARVLVERAAGRCLSDPSLAVSLAALLGMGGDIIQQDPTTGPLGERLRENVPTGPIPVPLFVGQGQADTLIVESAQAAYVAERCAGDGNGPLAYTAYPGLDHLSLVADDSPLIADLLAWTEDRFLGRPAADTCPR